MAHCDDRLLWQCRRIGPLLLEEPELSLHSEVVRYLPQMFAASNGALDDKYW